jgi:AraC family transcriptional activator of pobA
MEEFKINDLYSGKEEMLPTAGKNEIGHFNIFLLDDHVGPCAKPLTYDRKQFYKITLIIGRNKIHYANKTIETDGPALLFTSPLIPYKWEPLDDQQSGYFCIFTEAFFNQFGNIRKYPVFQVGGNPMYCLTDEEVTYIKIIYIKMLGEISGTYPFKYDALRNLVYELVHSASRMQPVETLCIKTNAAIRISNLFMDLLNLQFPIEHVSQRLTLRSARDFAQRLNVHVNYLNRAVKKVSGKTTTQHINGRLVTEAQYALKFKDWSISEIGHCFGFEDPSSFNYFYKKETQLSPSQYRMV